MVIRMMEYDLHIALTHNLRDALHSFEMAICNTVVQCNKNGKNRDETCAYIQDIFVLAKEEAEEKVKRYWEE